MVSDASLLVLVPGSWVYDLCFEGAIASMGGKIARHNWCRIAPAGTKPWPLTAGAKRIDGRFNAYPLCAEERDTRETGKQKSACAHPCSVGMSVGISHVDVKLL
jgi:hypothetical protein